MKKIKGRYEIKSKLGEGGMGVVFLAYDPPPMDREVAIKTLPAFADRFVLDLFYKECNALKSLSHPNIVEIFDMGELEDAGQKKPFFVMPLLRGQTLEDLIKHESHRLTVERVVQIISQTCRGLQAAHEHGLVHRDLKPSNLFVINDDSVKIIDFGVAHIVDARSDAIGLKGTLVYMAPEQFQNKPASAQSDIFSLGVVCYEALTRRQPFRCATQEEIIEAVQTRTPPPASEVNPGVSQAISRAVHKAMAKQPWNRYDSAKEFAETLQKALHNLPIELFDPVRIQPRIERASKALEAGDFQFAGEILADLEAGGHIEPQITVLRTQLDQVVRRRTIAQLLESAQARYEDEEDPLALQKLHDILQLDPSNVQALSLKHKIDDRRSERQIEKWLRLAQEHVSTHSYGHAREALQNVLTLRPRDSRALLLQTDIEAEEQEYLHLRAQKARLYQSALNAWTNGDVSEALSHMRIVLELDGRAPDILSPGTGASYQTFYNKVQSEHDAINNGYADARRQLAAGDFQKALEICRGFLEKYPGQALFQALKFDVEEQQRQQLSAFIADVNRRLDAESDLNAKVSLLREAVKAYPAEPHFEGSLKLMVAKQELVNTIVLRAQVHEERGQINEAISDFETLRSIHPAYPGLKFEIERLQGRRDQQSRDAAKATWVRQFDRVRETGNHARMLEVVEKALGDFPDDAEFVELKKLAQHGLQEAEQAERLLAEGQRLCAQEKFSEGVDLLKRAHQLNERHPGIRSVLCNVLVEQARALVDTDWRAAEQLVENALELDPQDQPAKSVRARIAAARRETSIIECASQARRWQGAHELSRGEAELKRGLALYPNEPRLMAILETLRHELAESKSKTRMRDVERLRGLQRKVDSVTNQDECETIAEQTRTVAAVYLGEQPDHEIVTMAHEIERAARARVAHTNPPVLAETGALTPTASPTTLEPHSTSVVVEPKKREQIRFMTPATWIAVGTAMLLIVIGAAGMWRRRVVNTVAPPPSVSQGISVHVRTVPAGAVITVDAEILGTSEVELSLKPGEHLIEARLPGFADARQKISVDGNVLPPVDLALQPLVQSVRILAPDVESGDVWFDEVARKMEQGTLTVNVPADGQHVLRIAASRQSPETRIAFSTAAGTMPRVSLVEVPQRQAIVVSSLDREARVNSSFVGVPILVDGKPQAETSAYGLMITGLDPGIHEVTIVDGSTVRKMTFTVGSAPSLDAVLFSDRDVGNVLVLTAEDDVTVLVDGRPSARRTVAGQLRLTNLASQPHTMRVMKEGFASPGEQRVEVVKGQETIVRFSLVPVQKTATLAIRQMIPGMQVFLDDNVLGTVTPDGALTRSDIVPGPHALRFQMDGYQSKRLTRDFVAADTVVLSNSEIAMQRLPATLDIEADATVSVSVRKENTLIQEFFGSRKLSLSEGVYIVEGRNADGQKSESVRLNAGGSTSVHLQIAASSRMEGFEPALWDKKDTWYSRRGATRFALYNRPLPARITFTFSPPPRRLGVLGSHVKWVVSYKDAKNYAVIDVEAKELTRSVYIDGKKNDFPKIAHKMPWGSQFIHIAIEMTAAKLIHRFQSQGGEWQIFDVWDRTDPRYASVRSFADGEFGFDGEIEVSNFTFLPVDR